MNTLLVKFNVDNFDEHELSTIKSIGNEMSSEADVYISGLYIISKVSSEPKLCSDKFVDFIITLQLNPLNNFS